MEFEKHRKHDQTVETRKPFIAGKPACWGALNKAVVSDMTKGNGQCRFAVRFRGPMDLVAASN
jgi:hypothetical protein